MLLAHLSSVSSYESARVSVRRGVPRDASRRVTRCCGLDVHKKSVVACVLITPETGVVQRHLRTFSTMTAGLLALADWLESLQITVVAMESTGMYWRQVFNLLEEGPTIMLVNAQQMKAVPGRKTDIKDSE